MRLICPLSPIEQFEDPKLTLMTKSLSAFLSELSHSHFWEEVPFKKEREVETEQEL